ALPDLATPPSARAVRFALDEGHPVNWDGNPRHWGKALGTDDPLDALYLPLTAEHRTLGVLYLRMPAGRRLSSQERRVVLSLASQTAVVLERDRLAPPQTAAPARAGAARPQPAPPPP